MLEAERRPIDPGSRSPKVQRTKGLSTYVFSIKADGRSQDKKVIQPRQLAYPEQCSPMLVHFIPKVIIANSIPEYRFHGIECLFFFFLFLSMSGSSTIKCLRNIKINTD